jgi:luciferase family oxidoreductase group 1
MDFGTFHLFEATGSYAAAIDDQVELMVAAEELGFSSVWAAEHHFSEYGVCPSAVLALGAVARQTSRIRLGTGIVVLPFHNPLRAAAELAFVDQLSGGRLEVGVGRGYQARELAAFGVDPDESRSIANESLEIIRQAWTQDEVTFAGRHFRIDGVPVYPKPVQQPHPRVYLGSLSPETFPLVGMLGVHLLFTPTFREGEDIPAQVAAYKQAVRDHGDDPAERRIGALRMIHVADTDEQAREDFGPAWARFRAIAEGVNAPRNEREAARSDQTRYRGRPADLDAAARAGNVVAGDPDTVAREVVRMREEWGLSDLILWNRVGGLDRAKVLRSIQLFADEVMPRVRGAAVAAR